jgi:hypothetical protein
MTRFPIGVAVGLGVAVGVAVEVGIGVGVGERRRVALAGLEKAPTRVPPLVLRTARTR